MVGRGGVDGRNNFLSKNCANVVCCIAFVVGGVAKILGIEVLSEDETFLPFDQLIEQMFEAYGSLSRRRRRNLNRILRAKELK